MKTTSKQIAFRLTKEDKKELEALCEEFGENQSQVLRRALINLYISTFPPIDSLYEV